jgi:hypothetical protein
MCRRRLGIAACASTALAIALLGAPRSMRAADDFDKVHAEAGRLWYDNYLNALSLRDPGGATAVVPIARSLELAPAIRYCARCASSDACACMHARCSRWRRSSAASMRRDGWFSAR